MYLQSNRSRGCWRLSAAVILPPYSWLNDTVRALHPILNSFCALSQSSLSTVEPISPLFVPLTSIFTVASPSVQSNFHTSGLCLTIIPGMLFSIAFLISRSFWLIVFKLVSRFSIGIYVRSMSTL